ncbi:MAG TPA: DUF4340 domain-containing protein [Candidatus Limnocylindria bacterium]|nr:DUF4340 domain-containing protein [Candidatus Limnocylindria bacterium]
MSARRLAILGVLVVAAAALVLLVEAPVRRTGEEAVSGPRLVRIPPDAVDGIELTIGEHRVAAERVDGGWTSGGRPASPALADALEDLLRTLTTLRAVDRFKPRDGASFGLEPVPRARIVLRSRRGPVRILLGELNGARSAVYARRDGTPHVWLVGLYLVSAMERVVYFAQGGTPSPAAS